MRAAIIRACRALRNGEVVAYPTEAVFGLGCNPFDEEAFARILALKGRSVRKGVILIGADFAQLGPLLNRRYSQLWVAARATWPGPVTWILPARDGMPAWLTGGRSEIAVRVSSHPVAAALCRAFGGPLVSTSANLSGRPALRSSRAVRLQLGSGLGFVVNAPVGGRALASEIRHGRSGRRIR